jgi:hypothetical protein
MRKLPDKPGTDICGTAGVYSSLNEAPEALHAVVGGTNITSTSVACRICGKMLRFKQVSQTCVDPTRRLTQWPVEG